MTEPLRKPVFVKVEALRPGTFGHNLVVKVVSSKLVVDRKRPDGSGVRIAECTVGDETATITLTARNEQVDISQVGNTIVIRNAKIDMFKGLMRLAVDKWGLVELAPEPANFEPRVDYDLSAVEYELVSSMIGDD